MRVLNIKNTNLFNKFTVTSSIETVIKAINEGKFFEVKNEFIPGDIETIFLDQIATRENVHLIYTNEEVPVLISNDGFVSNLMSKEFYSQHKEAIIEAKKNYILNCNDNYCTIDKDIFDDVFFEKILEKYQDGSIVF